MSSPSRARPSTARQRVTDGAIALVAFGATVGLLIHGLGSSGTVAHQLDAIGVLLAACASLPLMWWRRAPLGVFALTTLASAMLMARGYPGGPPVGPTIALFLLAQNRDTHRPWTRRVVLIVIGMFCLHIGAFGVGHGQLPEIQLAVGALVWALAWFAGDRTRLRRQEVAELEQRAIRAERDAIQDRRLAVAEERARIARDLHDSAAHAINVIAVQAGAARLWQSADPGRTGAALETIEEVAHQTVAEIDQIVHSLREEAPEADGRPGWAGIQVEPPAGLAALNSLLAQHEDAGLPVIMTTVGEWRRPPAGVDRAAYRILQEALTNCARHGAGPAQVELAFGERALELTVSNPVRREGSGAFDAGTRGNGSGGHGLVGMRERAALLGGEFEAGRVDCDRTHPKPTGSFRVHARLPYAQQP